jgi:hypothetical protein
MQQESSLPSFQSNGPEALPRVADIDQRRRTRDLAEGIITGPAKRERTTIDNAGRLQPAWRRERASNSDGPRKAYGAVRFKDERKSAGVVGTFCPPTPLCPPTAPRSG